MNHVQKTKLSVLAIGGTAATVILWLAANFWYLAYQQHVDAVHLQQVSQIEVRLLRTTRELARERTTSSAQLIANKPLDPDSLDALSASQQRSSGLLQDILTEVRLLLEDDGIVHQLRYSEMATLNTVTVLEHTMASLETYRQDFANFYSTSPELPAFVDPDPDADKPNGSELQTRQYREYLHAGIYALTTTLIAHVHTLLEGIHFIPRTTIDQISNLQNLRDSVLGFNESVARDTALLAGPSMAMMEMSVQRSDMDINHRMVQLQRHYQERMSDTSMLDKLRSLTEDYIQNRKPLREQRLAEALGGKPSVLQLKPWLLFNASMKSEVDRMNDDIQSAISHQASAVESQALRRLLVDSLLMVLCLWIAVASFNLLRKIHYQAYHDRLTGLPNRSRCDHLLRECLIAQRQSASQVAVLIMDIDEFKSINDSVGHGIGDQLLNRIGRRLQSAVSEDMIVGFLGADQFIVIASAVSSAQELEELAGKLHAVLDRSFPIAGAELQVSSCIGMSLSLATESTAEELLNSAEIAMRQAKDIGKGCIQLFNQELADSYQQRIQMEIDLRKAIEENQFEVYYQPKVSAETGMVDGMEALVRWNHPSRGLVPPFQFIPVAESAGLISSIGNWVLREACRQTRVWQTAGYENLQVAVNVSAVQLLEDGFYDKVRDALQSSGLDASSLELEVTESIAMHDMSTVIACLKRLRASHISIAIDDFGTDYSSLRYLEELPLDKLKIDRAFIVKLDESDPGRSLANTIVLMARSFNLHTVAEGVETSDQLDKVVALGCDHIQGYYYSRPVSADELPAVIEQIQAMPHRQAAIRQAA